MRASADRRTEPAPTKPRADAPGCCRRGLCPPISRVRLCRIGSGTQIPSWKSRLPRRESRHLFSRSALLGLPGAVADGNRRRPGRGPGWRFRRQSRRRYRRWEGCGDRHPEYGPGAKRFIIGPRVPADEERPGPVRVSRSIGDVRRSDIGTPQPRSREPIGPARRRHHQNCRDHRPTCPSLQRRDHHHRTPSRDHPREPAGGARSLVRSPSASRPC